MMAGQKGNIMIHIQSQRFYERETGVRHYVAIMFDWNTQLKTREYTVMVDNKNHSVHDTKSNAFEEVVNIITANNWSSINRYSMKG